MKDEDKTKRAADKRIGENEGRFVMSARTGTLAPVSVRRVAKRFFIIFIPLVLILSIVFFLFYNAESNNSKELMKKEGTNEINHLVEAMNIEFRVIFSDLMFLSEQNELQQALDTAETINWEDLASEYLSFSARKQTYDQIRFIDDTGMEIVRVNFNYGNPIIVPREQLQPKAKRYYFEDTFRLAQGEVFVSPMDLNIEHGEIEQPLKQMLRFGTPIFDRDGHKRGIVILNYLAQNMTHHLELTPGGHDQIMLINSDGFWLHNPNPEDEWGFMYPDKEDRTFVNDCPEAWLTITADESGQFFNTDGLFTFVTIYPLLEGQKSSTGSGSAFEPSAQQIEVKGYYWKLVSFVPSSILSAVTGQILNGVLLIFALMVVIVAGGSWAGARAMVRRKQAEEEVKKYAEQLEQANVHLEEMSRHKSQFLASMSHELRTPLNSIIGYTKLMLDGLEGDINEEQKQDLQTVYNNSKHLLELINDLLDVAKIEAGKIVLSYEEFTISDFIAEVIPSVAQLAREKGLTLTYSVAPDIENLYADKAKTRQVLINILGNAIKFTNEGSVKLNVAESDGDTIFSVTDTGMGMKNEDLEAIFDSFKQVGPAQIAGYEGTGLGLAISKQFIEMQGGKIWAESKLGKGSTFTFTLPKKRVSSP